MSVAINCKQAISGSLVLIAFIGCVLGAGQVDMDPNVSEEHLDILSDSVEGISDIVDPDADLDQRRRAVEDLKEYVLDDIKRRDWELNRRTLFSGGDGWRRLGSYRVETVAAIEVLKRLATENVGNRDIKQLSREALSAIGERLSSLSNEILDRVAPMTDEELRHRVKNGLEALKQELKRVEDAEDEDAIIAYSAGYVVFRGRTARAFSNYRTNVIAYLRSRMLLAHVRSDSVVDSFAHAVRDIGKKDPDAEAVVLLDSLVVGDGAGWKTFVTGDTRFAQQKGDGRTVTVRPRHILILFSEPLFDRGDAFDDVRKVLHRLKQDPQHEALAGMAADSLEAIVDEFGTTSPRYGIMLSGDVEPMQQKSFRDMIEATNRARSQWGLPEITREELGEAHEILQDLPEVNENEEEDRTPSILQLRPVEED